MLPVGFNRKIRRTTGFDTSPPPLTGYILWLSTRNPDWYDLDGSDNLTTWYDQSGNGYDGTAGGIAPVFTTVAGVPCFEFNPSNTGSFIDGAIALSGTQASVIVVGRTLSSGNITGGIFCTSTSSSTSSTSTSGGYFLGRNTGNVEAKFGATGVVQPHLHDTWYAWCSRFREVTTSNSGIRNNLGANNSFTVPTWTLGSTVYRIGKDTISTDAERFGGYVAEVIVYNTRITNTNTDNILNFLEAVYGF